ncbi:pyridoxal 5'-phosphate synthase glutaminase subunit PdxT [Leucobacter tenebrionis]|uniref:pyridoxal 5'-phosphate synthase glutaminase subunit PdxT n=1 Tax=Leucobacter tenebrionis TaxID=2873270 RepID=UPI002103DBAE|nr:pyridoxal 5'-phosphate synthase glutaminase subunit PdxT [Leucobacter tenebrionis]
MSRSLRSRPTVGVLALQGGVAEHTRTVEALGARAVAVRRAEHLAGPDGPRIDALILPGGESGAIDRLARRFGLFEPLRDAVHGTIPVLGTCAGLILLAARVEDPAPGQRSLGGLDITVRRNAIGPQLASAEQEFDVMAAGFTGPVRGALIRAPEVVGLGPGARAIARRDGRLLGATSVEPGAVVPDAVEPLEPDPDPAALRKLGRVTGVSFHPELSNDPSLHRALLALV